MYARLDYIFVKNSDFKVCKECGHINWYENEECFFCEHKEFEFGEAVSIAVDEEYEFYQEEYKITELGCDAVEIEV